jgi:hypothetical protein
MKVGKQFDICLMYWSFLEDLLPNGTYYVENNKPQIYFGYKNTIHEITQLSLFDRFLISWISLPTKIGTPRTKVISQCIKSIQTLQCRAKK